jgi:hypothetical protein
VAHTYNPSYSGGRGQRVSRFEVILGKKFMRPYLNEYEKLGMLVYTCQISYLGSIFVVQTAWV